MFTSDFFRDNRERLQQLFTGTAPIVVSAHGLLQMGSDAAYPFYQDRNFLYLTGIDVPGVILVIDKGKEYLIVPDRATVMEQFDGAIDIDALKRISGIATVLTEKEGWKQLQGRIRKVQHVATLGAAPRYIEHWALYTNPARADLHQRIKEINPQVELLDLRTHLARMRMIKQPVEIDALQRAIDLTMATIKDITRPKQLAKYGFEYEIEADLLRGFRRTGAMGQAFDPIVASGGHACNMHYTANNGPLATGDLLVLDVGASVDFYSADITRTVSLGGSPSRRQQQVHQAVKEVQNYAFSLLKPGLVMRDYEKQIESFMGEKLRELGLIKTIESDRVRHFYPHATSHFLGLDTHDGGDYDHPLEPGTVLTVEPGIYIPDEEIGIRIEDDVVITTDGYKNLSASLSRELV